VIVGGLEWVAKVAGVNEAQQEVEKYQDATQQAAESTEAANSRMAGGAAKTGRFSGAMDRASGQVDRFDTKAEVLNGTLFFLIAKFTSLLGILRLFGKAAGLVRSAIGWKLRAINRVLAIWKRLKAIPSLVKKWIGRAVAFLKGILGRAVGWVKKWVSRILARLPSLSQAWQFIKGVAQKAWRWFTGTLGRLVGWAKKWVGRLLSKFPSLRAIWQTLKLYAGKAWRWFTRLLGSLVGWAKKWVGRLLAKFPRLARLWQLVKAIAGKAARWFRAQLSGLVGWAKKWVGRLLARIPRLRELPRLVRQYASRAAGALRGALSGAVKWARGWVGRIVRAFAKLNIGQYIRSAVQTAARWLGRLKGPLKSMLRIGWSILKFAGGKSWGAAIGAALGVAVVRQLQNSGVMDTVSEYGEKLRKWIGPGTADAILTAWSLGGGGIIAVLGGFINGFASKIDEGLVPAVDAGFREAGRVAGVLFDVWERTFAGVGQWLDTNVVQPAVGAWRGFKGGVIDWVTGTYDWLVRTSASAGRTVWQKLTGVASSAKRALLKPFDRLGSAIADLERRLPGRISRLAGAVSRAASSIFSDTWNAIIPETVGLPTINVGGKSFGGATVDLPQLAVGGVIEQAGAAMLHPGETVVPAPADVSRGFDPEALGGVLAEAMGGGSGTAQATNGGQAGDGPLVGTIEIGDQTMDLSQMSRSRMQELVRMLAEEIGTDVGLRTGYSGR
jgi:hypothetical protein